MSVDLLVERKCHGMRQYLGSIILTLLSISAPVIGAVENWPWPWWIFGGMAIGLLIGAYLTRPRREVPRSAPVPTAFVGGDASGSTFRNIYTDADYVVHGNARRAIFRNIIHRRQQSKE